MRNLDVVAEQLFNEIRGRYPSVTIGDDKGNVTNEPRLARFYEFDFKSQQTNMGKVSVSLDEKTGVTIMYNKDFTAEVGDAETKDWYNFLKGIRMFSKKRLLNFEVRDINRTNFTKRDYSYMAVNRGEQQMAESKMYGTNKTSFQKFGGAKLSIKHTGMIDEGESRTKKIGSLYIENNQGEKFKYPFKHLAGARAMAIHVGEGGHPFDDFGKHITSLSEELSNLRKFKTYMGRSSVMAESLSEHMDIVNERITSIKKRVQTLQKPASYKNAFEEFIPIEESVVPDEVQEDWINQLTIKQFNEELKDVFPYIYKLISENTAVESLGFEDIVNELDSSPRPMARPTMYKTPQEAEAAAVEELKNMPGQMKPTMEKGVDYTIKAVNGMFTYELAPETSNIGSTEIAPNGQMTGSTRGTTESEIDMAFDKILGQFADNFSAQVEGEHDKDGDGDEDEDDYAIAKDIAIKKAIAKRAEEEPEGIKAMKDAGNAKADAEAKEKKTPLGEFILSYFDRKTGQFPKGETAVLTSVEKDYGDQYVKPASQFIERLGHVYEKYQARKMADFTRIQELAGLR